MLLYRNAEIDSLLGKCTSSLITIKYWVAEFKRGCMTRRGHVTSALWSLGALPTLVREVTLGRLHNVMLLHLGLDVPRQTLTPVAFGGHGPLHASSALLPNFLIPNVVVRPSTTLVSLRADGLFITTETTASSQARR